MLEVEKAMAEREKPDVSPLGSSSEDISRYEEIRLPVRVVHGPHRSPPGNEQIEGREVLRPRPHGEARLRVALYSHDTLGLGHLRRNMLIARALASAPTGCTNLLITGAHEANFFSLPERVDCLTLPRIQKNDAGEYSVGQLDISVERLTRMRGMSICSVLEHFQPDLLIVDKVPKGAFDELVPVLEMLRSDRGTRCVLGIRDVLDDAATVRREWQRESYEGAIDRYYDEIWVYGDRRVYDPRHEYGWSDAVADKVRFTGYLDRSARHASHVEATSASSPPAGTNPADASILASFLRPREPSVSRVLCTLGGGQDGYPLARVFLDSLADKNVTGLLLSGPFMPAELFARLQDRAARLKNVQVVRFAPQADRLLGSADRVIAMAGYNTVCEILTYGKPALLVPRVSPRQEQLIRTRRLCELGLVDMLHPQDLSPATIGRWLSQTPAAQTDSRYRLDLNGLSRIQDYATCLTQKCPIHPTRTAHS